MRSSAWSCRSSRIRADSRSATRRTSSLLQDFRAGLHRSLAWSVEVPLPIPGDRRAWDGVIQGPGWRYGVEAETAPRDSQSLARRLSLKQRDGARDGRPARPPSDGSDPAVPGRGGRDARRGLSGGRKTGGGTARGWRRSWGKRHHPRSAAADRRFRGLPPEQATARPDRATVSNRLVARRRKSLPREPGSGQSLAARRGRLSRPGQCRWPQDVAVLAGDEPHAGPHGRVPAAGRASAGPERAGAPTRRRPARGHRRTARAAPARSTTPGSP